MNMAVDYAKLDRVMRGVRILVGLGLLSLTVVGPRSLWGFGGILPIVVGISGRCPASRLFGRTVCPTPTGADHVVRANKGVR
jgi:Inner membrane protein YgaP-like, transmembrane domain